MPVGFVRIVEEKEMPRKKTRRKRTKQFFPSKKGLPIRIVVYVPSTQGMTKKISKSVHLRRARQVSTKLRRLFGGTTRVVGLGSWKHKGKVIRENVLLVESFCDVSDWKKHSKEIKVYLQKKKREWKQETLSIEWEHLSANKSYEGMHFI